MENCLRYKLAPQMIEYDKIALNWLPYVMYFHFSNYASKAINTCPKGFRVSYENSKPIKDISYYADRATCLLVGSSVAFGVGASSDKTTLTSLLNEITDYSWFNFSGRGFNSTQEFLLFCLNHHHFKNLKKVIILSGINNLILNCIASNYSKEFGNFYFQSLYEQATNTKFRELAISPKRKLFKRWLYPIYADNIDYTTVSKKEIISYFFKKPIPKQQNKESKKEDLVHILNRDLSNWKAMSKSLGIEIIYILQPFASWIDKKLSTEEERLFPEADARPGSIWHIAKNKLDREKYNWYVNTLSKICLSNDIKFFDMNALISNRGLDGEWLFIDRYHFTDKGYHTVAQIIKEEIV